MAARIAYGYGFSAITALKFDAPITEELVDPTTIEGFKSAIGNIQVYEKPKNFVNTFVNYDIADVNTYANYKNAFFVNSGETWSALTTANDYYFCDGGNWTEKYSKLRYPYPVDLEQKISDGFPVKFTFTQYDKNENGFWNSLYNTMSRTEIKDAFWGARLFAGSNVPRMNLTFNPSYGTIDGTNVTEQTTAVLDGCFDGCSSLQSATMTRKGDEKHFNTLTNVFRGCTSLSALTFNSKDSEGAASTEKWRVGQLSGTFEFCRSLVNWPANIVISNTQFDSTNANDSVAQIDYTFEGSGFESIGSGEEFKVGAARQAFNSLVANDVTVNSTLDMRYIHPENASHVYNMFGNNKISNIELKKINHNSWNFDGVTSGRESQPIGDCTLFDQPSVEYLFHNLYDLTSNALDENILRRKPTIPGFQNWTAGGSGVDKRYVYVGFSASNGYITINDVNGKFFKFTVSNMQSGEQLTLTDGVQTKTITQDGSYYIDIEGTSCTLTADIVNSNNVIEINYIQDWSGEVSTVTASTLYCPAEWDNSEHSRIIDDEMVTIATNRGWMVRVNDVLHTVRVEVVLADNELVVGETTTAKVYFVRTRGEVETRTEITDNTGITYYSTDSNIASVDDNGEVTANGNGDAYIYVTFSGLTSSISDENAKEEVTSEEYYQLLLNPSASTVSQSSPTAQITATYRHYLNGVITDTDVTSAATWTLTGDSSNYVTLNQGLVTWTNNPASDMSGSYVSASYSGYDSTVNLTIVHAISEEYVLLISPSSQTIQHIDNTAEFTATYQYWKDGVLISSTDVTSAATWAVSGNASDYTTISRGVVTKVSGTTSEEYGTINATYSGTPAYNNPDITIRYDTTYNLELTINKASINVGETAQCTSILYEYHDGSGYTGNYTGKTYDSDYSSDDTSIATVITGQWSLNGKITGIGGGTANITATYVYRGETYTDTKPVTVVKEEYVLLISPASQTIYDIGNTAEFTATYQYWKDGVLISSTDVTSAATWAVSGNASDYTTISRGVVTKTGATSEEANGIIHATYEGTASLSNPTIEINYSTTYDIQLTIQRPTINWNETTFSTVRFNEYHDGIETSHSGVSYECTYTSDDTSVATVVATGWNVAGKITGVNGGTANITATYVYRGETYTDTKPVTVVNVVTHRIDVYGTNVQVGLTGQCTADYVTITNGVESSRVAIPANDAVWTTDDSSILSIDNNAVITGNAVGSTNVNCSYLDETGSTQVSVINANVTAITVEITDVPTMPASGGTITSAHTGVQYTITAYYSNGTSGDVTTDITVIKSGNTVSAATLGSGVTTEETPCIPDLKIEARYQGFYDSDTETIYQEINEAGVPIVVSSWTVNGEIRTDGTDYFINVANRNITGLSQTGGTVNNAVSGYSVTHYTMPITQVTKYEIDYTSGDKSYDEQSMPLSPSAWTTTNLNEPVSVSSNPNWVSQINTGTSGNFTYSENNDPDRSGSIVYQLVNSSATTVTTNVSQNGLYEIIVSPWDFDDVSADGLVTGSSVVLTNLDSWEMGVAPNWVTIQPTADTGNSNITINISANPSTSDTRNCTIYFSGYTNGTLKDTDYIEIAQKAATPVVLLRVWPQINSVPDIPASGGSVNYNSEGVSYTVYAEYSDGDVIEVTPTYISSNSVTASSLSTNVTNSRTEIDDLVITVRYGGKEGTGTEPVYQGINYLTTGESTGTTNVESHEYKEGSGALDYGINIDPSTKTVSYEQGSFGITVSAYTVIIYSSYTYDTYQIETTPWSSYTAEPWQHPGQSTTGSTVLSGDSHYEGADTRYPKRDVVLSSKPSWVTTATVSNISYEANDGDSGRTGEVVYCIDTHRQTQISCTITQEANVVSLLYIEVVFTEEAPIIPASGGSVDCGDVRYQVIAHYSDSSSGDVTSLATITCDDVDAQSKGTTVTGATTAGTLTIYAEYEEETDDDSLDITQEANELTTGETTGKTNESTSAWTEPGSVVYAIDVSPVSESVSSGSGSFSVSVYASAITTVYDCSCPTWQVVTTPWSSYTAEPWQHPGQSTTGSTQKGDITRVARTSTTLTNAVKQSGGANWITASEVNNTTHRASIQYATNTGSSRNSEVVYAVANDSSVTGSCTVYQEEGEITPDTRTITIKPSSNSWYVDCEHFPVSITSGAFTITETNVASGTIYGSGSFQNGRQNWQVSGEIKFTTNIMSAMTVTLNFIETISLTPYNVQGYNELGDLNGTVTGSVGISFDIDIPASSGDITISIPRRQPNMKFSYAN